MKRYVQFIWVTFIFLRLTVAASAQNKPSIKVLPTPQQVTWANEGVGVIIHLDLNIFAPATFNPRDKKTLPPLSIFNPSKLNTDQWIRVAKSAGAKYAILVAKHTTGFALWPTKANDFNVSHTPWKQGKGDIVADFIKSCKKYGLKPGIYYNTNVNTYYGVDYGVPFVSDEARDAYDGVVLAQLKELWTHYGNLFEIWFDGGVRGSMINKISGMVRKYQPEAILFQGPKSCPNLIRWVGNEYGQAPYPMWSRTDTVTSSNGLTAVKGLNGDPDGEIWAPAESDFPNLENSAWQGGWFWRANESAKLVPVKELVKRYYHTVGRNTNMLIGMPIDTAGQFPEKYALQLQHFGKEIKRLFAHPIARTSGAGKEIVLNLGPKPASVNQIVLKEKISQGERIRKYSVEAWIRGEWKQVCDGVSVGHERIQLFDEVTTSKLKLSVQKSEGEPLISEFSAYYVKESQM